MATGELIDIGQRETVVEAIARALIDYIARKGLQPGSKLPTERELVEMTGASRLPLREALCMLKGLGVLEAKHGKGIYVKPLDIGAVFEALSPLLKVHAGLDKDHIATVRHYLEGGVAEMAALNRTEENLAVMRLAIDQMWVNLAERAVYIRHDMTFHHELGRATHNPIFQALMSCIADLFVEIQWLYPNRTDFFEEATEEHERVFEAVRDGDGPRAKAAIREHILNARKRL